MSSDKGEEAFNFVYITPLDLWDPNGVRDLVTLEDDSNGSMKEELEPSEWGENDDQSFWYFCGIPHCLLRETVYYFFQKLERFGSSKRLLLQLVGQATLPKKV